MCRRCPLRSVLESAWKEACFVTCTIWLVRTSFVPQKCPLRHGKATIGTPHVSASQTSLVSSPRHVARTCITDPANDKSRQSPSRPHRASVPSASPLTDFASCITYMIQFWIWEGSIWVSSLWLLGLPRDRITGGGVRKMMWQTKQNNHLAVLFQIIQPPVLANSSPCHNTSYRNQCTLTLS